jgi:hypothetical protein
MLREVISNEWITILIVICITILTIVKFSYSKRFNDFLWIILNSNYLKIYFKDNKFIDNFNILLFANQIIGVFIFVYLISKNYINDLSIDLIVSLKIIGVFIVLIFTKFFIELLIGWVFNINTLISSYLFQKMNYKNFIGIVLIPINMILVYAVEPTEKLIYGFLIGLLVLNFIGFLSTFKSYQKLILSNFFYFILYLCALEIGPYIILYKLFN